MKFPKHILLDVRSNFLIYTNRYWIQYAFFSFGESVFFTKTQYFFKFLVLQNKPSSRLFSIKLQPYLLVKNYSRINKKLQNAVSVVNLLGRRALAKNFSTKSVGCADRANSQNPLAKKVNCANSLQSLFIISFLKKEKLYTKLKYSRVPQYDSVSGGAAALLAGFLGFLICEKFGFELLDSGDFYFLFMYAVFFLFFAGLLVKTSAVDSYPWRVINFKNLWAFYYVNALFLFKIVNVGK